MHPITLHPPEEGNFGVVWDSAPRHAATDRYTTKKPSPTPPTEG